MNWRMEWRKLLLKIKIQKKRMKRNEDSLRDLWDNINIHIIRVPEEERKDLRKHLKR